MLSGARTTRALKSCSLMRERTRDSLRSSRGHATVLVTSFVSDNCTILIGKGPRGLFGFDQAIHGRVQRRRNANALRLFRNRTAQKFDLSWKLVAHVIQHRRRMIGHRPDLVHGPGVFVESYAGGSRHAFTFFNYSTRL